MSYPLPHELALAAALRQARRERGITQLELAVDIGVSLNAVGSWERGERRPTAPCLARWLRALGIEGVNIQLKRAA